MDIVRIYYLGFPTSPSLLPLTSVLLWSYWRKVINIKHFWNSGKNPGLLKGQWVPFAVWRKCSSCLFTADLPVLFSVNQNTACNTMPSSSFLYTTQFSLFTFVPLASEAVNHQHQPVITRNEPFHSTGKYKDIHVVLVALQWWIWWISLGFYWVWAFHILKMMGMRNL